MEARLDTLIKVLSANDVGATGSHQAGIVVPREERALSFFPRLDSSKLNPRANVVFMDRAAGGTLTLSYIYYNGKTLGQSTRNEYRLTGLSRFLREGGAQVGDSLEFTRAGDQYSIDLHRPSDAAPSEGSDIIVLSGTWKTIRKGRFL